MAASNPPKLSLYANLLKPKSDEASGATISSAPVLYKQASQDGNGEADKKSETATQFRFQPGSVKRPQQSAQKPKKKPIHHPLPTSAAPPTAASSADGVATNIPAIGAASTDAQRATYSLADWMDDGDDVNEFLEQKRPRKKKKKGKNAGDEGPREVNWDDFYDLREWTNLDQWKTSVARIRKHNEWKDYLKSHARGSKERRSSYSSDGSSPPRRPMPSAFAPPAGMSFAPPTSFDGPQLENLDQEMPDAGRMDQPHISVDDPSGEDAYLRRMQMSKTSASDPPPPPPPDSVPIPPPPPPATRPNATISRAPVRYTLPEAPPNLPAQDDNLDVSEDEMDIDLPTETADTPNEPQAPSRRPGQKGFAERYMAKLGYQKGQGLGADGSGITSALSVQKQKQKKRSDAEGGGVVNKAAMGKIVGGKKSKKDDEGLHGKMSSVVKLDGMLDGMDIEAELGMNGSFVQEIGQECGDKYGTVERVYVARAVSATNPPVFVKFTSELSALRAVNALNGRSFASKTIAARFWNVDKFEDGIYEVSHKSTVKAEPVKAEAPKEEDMSGWD